MIKKIFIILNIILLLSFTSCGGGESSSKEAKELLQKILQFVGIPQEIVVNICQDSNKDGICGNGELFTKIIIKKDELIDNILEKISLTADGRYFLETYNPEFPILVELQDTSKIDYDNGKFTLNFNGFKTRKNDNESKEISILESMIDNNTLNKDIANKFRTLQNQEAQDKYYVMLLDTLENNINTLREKGLDSKTAVKASIKEMGDETKDNQGQADNINRCEDNQTCIDNEIKKTADKLIITQEESSQIIEQNNNPTPTPLSMTDGKEVQYGKWIKPSKNICENNGGIYNNTINDCQANWENANTICNASNSELPTIDTLKQVIIDCGGNPESDDSENKSYQSCYKENGFISDFYFYWSSTDSSDSSNAWVVYFYKGIYYEIIKNQYRESRIRCVKER